MWTPRIHHRQHTKAVRDAAYALMAQGWQSTAIARELGVPAKTVQTWARVRQISFKEPATAQPKPKSKSGSGVIAPPVYRRGYRWFSGGVAG